jgi:6-pyruvoyltetrahydropterin/6-carboxytetrahydropterin synthase
MIRVTRQYRFSASHRLHAAALSDEENRAVFGKCNNPHGHGHNYVLEVSARGPVDEETGLAVDVSKLDRLVRDSVLRDIETTDLNRLPDFSERVPTTENLAEALLSRLTQAWRAAFSEEWPVLDGVRIRETPRNTFEVRPLGR